jgi:hypothetical protein
MIRRSILAGLVLAASPAFAGEYTTYSVLDVAQAAGCDAPALLNLPAGWSSGDAAVVLLTAAPLVDATRDGLVAALLAEQAAVLEMVPSPCADGSRPDAAGAALGALRALHVTEGAGLVIAIGYGPGGRAALAAADEAQAAARLGPSGPRFAATLAIGDGPPTMLPGPEQPPALRAPLRLSLLCDTLAQAGAATALPSPAACRDALVQPAPPEVRPAALRLR